MWYRIIINIWFVDKIITPCVIICAYVLTYYYRCQEFTIPFSKSVTIFWGENYRFPHKMHFFLTPPKFTPPRLILKPKKWDHFSIWFGGFSDTSFSISQNKKNIFSIEGNSKLAHKSNINLHSPALAFINIAANLFFIDKLFKIIDNIPNIFNPHNHF